MSPDGTNLPLEESPEIKLVDEELRRQDIKDSQQIKPKQQNNAQASRLLYIKEEDVMVSSEAESLGNSNPDSFS